MLEDETTLETFLSKQRRWLAARVATLTHLHLALLVSKGGICSTETIAGLR
jgi:hypothetical protein